MSGRIAQINVSAGGVPKLPVARAQLEVLGLTDDAQANLELHGGPERALCLWSLEIIAALQAEGHPIAAGSTGENLTLSGLSWAQLIPGVRLQLGAHALIEITDYATPCRTIWKSFAFRRYGRISQKRHPGQSRLYARVLRPGALEVGAAVSVVDAREP